MTSPCCALNNLCTEGFRPVRFHSAGSGRGWAQLLSPRPLQSAVYAAICAARATRMRSRPGGIPLIGELSHRARSGSARGTRRYRASDIDACRLRWLADRRNCTSVDARSLVGWSLPGRCTGDRSTQAGGGTAIACGTIAEWIRANAHARSPPTSRAGAIDAGAVAGLPGQTSPRSSRQSIQPASRVCVWSTTRATPSG